MYYLYKSIAILMQFDCSVFGCLVLYKGAHNAWNIPNALSRLPVYVAEYEWK
jgi:hypothetical protein